jgi:hypothetical protein
MTAARSDAEVIASTRRERGFRKAEERRGVARGVEFYFCHLIMLCGWDLRIVLVGWVMVRVRGLWFLCGKGEVF